MNQPRFLCVISMCYCRLPVGSTGFTHLTAHHHWKEIMLLLLMVNNLHTPLPSNQLTSPLHHSSLLCMHHQCAFPIKHKTTLTVHSQHAFEIFEICSGTFKKLIEGFSFEIVLGEKKGNVKAKKELLIKKNG